jgi:hypothetical protein
MSSKLLRAAPELSTLRVLCSTLDAVADLVDAVHPRLVGVGSSGPGDEAAGRLTVALGACAAAAEDYPPPGGPCRTNQIQRGHTAARSLRWATFSR